MMETAVASLSQEEVSKGGQEYKEPLLFCARTNLEDRQGLRISRLYYILSGGEVKNLFRKSSSFRPAARESWSVFAPLRLRIRSLSSWIILFGLFCKSRAFAFDSLIYI